MSAPRVLSDRISVSYLIALGIHAVLLIGISFSLELNPLRKAAETLDVVLVNWKSEATPDEAEFLANAAQEGGGDFEEIEKPSEEISSELPSLAPGDMPVSSPEELPAPSPDTRDTLIAEITEAPPAPAETAVEQPEPPLPSAAELMQQSMQVAQLQPQTDRERQWKSKLPKRKFISANTREYEYATYMHAWVSKVERVGNRNYPMELKERKISGALLMTVGINRDGSVESISIRNSSGIDELDQAAVRIVRLAAPYSPLPAEIAESIDVLHITRTWRFSHGDVFE